MKGLWKRNVSGYNHKDTYRKKTKLKHIIKDNLYHHKKKIKDITHTSFDDANHSSKSTRYNTVQVYEVKYKNSTKRYRVCNVFENISKSFIMWIDIDTNDYTPDNPIIIKKLFRHTLIDFIWVKDNRRI